MLLSTAIGDAYGAGYEYTAFEPAENNLSGYRRHPTHGLFPGQYTDDTQMSIAVAEAYLEDPFQNWTRESLWKRFFNAFKRDPRDGYSRGFQAILEKAETAEELQALIIPDSDKSGGAMRAGPCGLFEDVWDVIAASELQASLTHDTVDGKAAAVAAALMVHHFAYDLGPKCDLGKWLNNQLCHYPNGYGLRDWDEPWVGKIKSKGWMDVRAAITVIQRNDSLSKALIDIVNFTGDVDTAAAIMMAAASWSREMKKDLPLVLHEHLENGQYGREYLMELDGRLLAKV